MTDSAGRIGDAPVIPLRPAVATFQKLLHDGCSGRRPNRASATCKRRSPYFFVERSSSSNFSRTKFALASPVSISLWVRMATICLET